MNDFWSRRKAAVEAEADAEVAALQVAEAEQTEAELAERDDADILEELGLPEPEALESPEAVRDFLGQAVPQRLKTRALRRLWRLNPVLANLDGLVDYGEDFTDAATVIENLQTAYQVGKGMLAHVEELAKTKVEEDAPEPSEVEDVPEVAMMPESEDAVQDEVAEEPSAPIIAEAEEEPAALAPRRMQFRFEEPA